MLRVDFPFAVTQTEDMAIILSDGTRLSARVWMPENALAEPVPAILEYIPYRKRDGTLQRDELMHPWFAGQGYAAIRVDMRGNGDSQGVMDDEYSPTEMADAQEVIAWIADQPWCSGAVGMMGKSWGGFNCLQAAYNQGGQGPLKAVISVCSTTNRFTDDIHFKGGCLLGENFGWGSVMLAYSARPPDPLLVENWVEEWVKRLEAEPWLAPRWAAHQAADAYWQHGSVGVDWAKNQLPVLIWGGWADNYMNAVGAMVQHVPGRAQGIVGPWVHQYPHTAVPGPQIGFLQCALRWWDRWLKNQDNGAEEDPAYRAYILHSAPPNASASFRPGHWVSLSAWPAPEVEPQAMTLTDQGLRGEPGPLSDAVIASPQDLGLFAGEFFPMGLNGEMPGDQALDDAASLCFETDVLSNELTLLGAAQLDLRLISDQDKGFVVARLCDVAPDGQSVRIAHGMVNLCHRAGMDRPELVPIGQEITVRLKLDDMGYRLATGHRLRLALSNAYWPFVWPSGRAAQLQLCAGQISLPVLGAQLPSWQPPPAEHAAPRGHRVLRAPRAAREITRDPNGGKVTLRVLDDQGETENIDHGLITGETLTELWEINPDDPLSARVEHQWEQRLTRGDWNVLIKAWSEMWADETHLHLSAKLRAWDSGELVFERAWDDRVERRSI